MCDALRELMKPEMDEAVDTAVDSSKKETAERMIRAGKLTDQDIADYSGLTLKQVQEIKDKLLVTA